VNKIILINLITDNLCFIFCYYFFVFLLVTINYSKLIKNSSLNYKFCFYLLN